MTTLAARLPRARLAAAPPAAYFVGSAVFHYLGPAFAVLLFVRVEPLGVAWLRIASAAVIFALWRRPWRGLAALDREARRTLLAMGVVLALMNSCFYVAIDHLPLGTVAAIEFLPVIGLAALGVRTPRNAFALGLAIPGVYVLTDVQLAGEPLGIAFAFANAGLFALYIVLAHRISRSSSLGRIDGLAGSMLIAAVAITPIGLASAAPALLDPVAIAAGIGVGIASSVIPYVCDQLAMARLTRSAYSLMVSLLPATATIVGIVVLAQIPSALEILGVGLVVAAVGVHRERTA
jgi:inner membrane transporter RhtA